MKIKLRVLTIAIILSQVVFAQEEKELNIVSSTPQETTVRVTARNVTGNTYWIVGKGGNIGFHVGEDEILMVDNQFADASEAILEEIKKISDKPIKYLINTHHHGDHIGGNENMTENGTTIIAHENVRKKMLSVKSEIKVKALPVITFSENMTLHFDSEEIFAFHINNAHTNGDVVIYFPQTNVLHTGDAFVNKTYPYIDEESGGTLEGYIKGLEKMMMIVHSKTTKIIPGHGPIGSLIDVDYTKRMLENIITKVKIEISRGKTEEEIVANGEVTKFYDDLGYGNGFISSEKIRRTVYRHVSGTYEDDQEAKIKELKKLDRAKSNKG
jgi:glyoxylase-like metal-dependent hydrolase (beta-lactamase superfamily II)